MSAKTSDVIQLSGLDSSLQTTMLKCLASQKRRLVKYINKDHIPDYGNSQAGAAQHERAGLTAPQYNRHEIRILSPSQFEHDSCDHFRILTIAHVTWTCICRFFGE